MRVRVDAMRSEDLPLAVELFRSSFDTDRTKFMAMAQAGYERHLSSVLRYGPRVTGQVMLVARDETQAHSPVVGCADIRFAGTGMAFLSYIAIAPAVRGRGVATKLLEGFMLRYPAADRWELDVFSDNGPARALYRKLGFSEVSEFAWVRRDLPALGEPLMLAGVGVSDAAHEALGFSEYVVVQEGAQRRVGRIGEHLLRCDSVEDLRDDGLLAGLRAIEPKLRWAFAIVPVGEVDETGDIVEIARVHRMAAPASALKGG